MDLENFDDDSIVDKNDLKFFYSRIYPFDIMSKWLSYELGTGSSNLLPNREFSMTLISNMGEDEIYLRWQSYMTIDQLKQELVNRVPHKFDIGAIYNIPVAEKDISPLGFTPYQRELVFDIDMNDYDDIRTCCKDKKICNKCWLYIALAIKLIDTSLHEDFGFRHVLWIYSGRRGVHCWVCDTKARLIPTEARIAIVDYLTLVTGNDNRKKKVNLKFAIANSKLHPFIERCYSICIQYFDRIIEEQDLFHHNSDHIQKILDHVSDDSKVLQILKIWISNNTCKGFTSTEFWLTLKKILEEVHGKNCTTLKEIVFAFSYPRLDTNVSKDLGHLLKAPMCIHHGTGRLCVPIDPTTVEFFNPQCVPTLTKIRAEYDAISTESTIQTSICNENYNVNTHQLPCIKKYSDFLNSFISNLVISMQREQKEYLTVLKIAESK
ncbi:DNA primase small subunit [Cryptosporidium andersoni]|uniref:DNA primase n=1 Tax=Cryptosporidium andersoni TaxID=117008 RepID=A0A1J4MES3_9CRYT|nr:DNA primase small subunit [Cryptosporidium andersoni]